MSGNICAATNSPSPCSKATTTSSTNPAPRGASSPTTPNASHQSHPELGRRSILEADGITTGRTASHVEPYVQSLKQKQPRVRRDSAVDFEPLRVRNFAIRAKDDRLKPSDRRCRSSTLRRLLVRDARRCRIGSLAHQTI